MCVNCAHIQLRLLLAMLHIAAYTAIVRRYHAVMLFNASNARNTRKLYVIGTAYIVAGVY